MYKDRYRSAASFACPLGSAVSARRVAAWSFDHALIPCKFVSSRAAPPLFQQKETKGAKPIPGQPSRAVDPTQWLSSVDRSIHTSFTSEGSTTSLFKPNVSNYVSEMSILETPKRPTGLEDHQFQEQDLTGIDSATGTRLTLRPTTSSSSVREPRGRHWHPKH